MDFSECYNNYSYNRDLEGFKVCAYKKLLEKLDYPLDQGVVRNSREYCKYKAAVYDFGVNVCQISNVEKSLKRLPPT